MGGSFLFARRLLGAALCALTLLAAPVWAHHRSFKGRALYYSDRYIGSTMACGGEYRPWKMIAAHRRLPCGTKLRVRNLKNGEVVTVTVRDRGPFGTEAKLDVSRRAAKRLGFYVDGRTMVRARILHDS
jgi:rare lipoprotein A